MRACRFVVAFLLSACAAPPPPRAASAKEVVAVGPKAPPPAEALASKDVSLTQRSEFLAFAVGSVRLDLLSDEDLVARLPAAAKTEWRAVENARKAVRVSEHRASRAHLAYLECGACRQKAALERRRAPAQRALARAVSRLKRAVKHAEDSLYKQLASPKPVPALGIALARLEVRGSSPYDRDHLEWTAQYGASSRDLPGVDALARALPLASAGEEMGQRVRQELLLRLRSSKDGPRADQLIDELLPRCPATWRAELEFRRGLFRAMQGQDSRAAQSFDKALGLVVPGSTVSRRTLASAVLLARYRALDFKQALTAAMRAVKEMARPEPPPAPARPKPKGKPKARISAREAAAREAALREAAEFGVFGLLSSASGSPLSERAVIALGADCVERLGRDPTLLDGPPAARAGILSDLAVRALYRGNAARAKRIAQAARELGPLPETRDALDVLRVLALRAGDREGERKLAHEARGLGSFGAGGYFGPSDSLEGRDLERRLAVAHGARRTPADQRRASEAPVARTVRSLLRVCVEPVRTRLPEAHDAPVIATVTLNARVFNDGHAEVSAKADRNEGSVPQVLECLDQLGPRLFAHAPSGVHATVALDDSVRHADSALEFGGPGTPGKRGTMSSGLGEAFGYGGLGLRGGGAAGRGLRTIGRGPGLAGTGSGYGHGRGKHAAKKKRPAKK